MVQQVPRTIYGQRQQLEQHVIHTARVVETPQVTEVELPQVIQQVIPGRARQYMGPPRIVGQVQGGVQEVGQTVVNGAAPFVAPTQFGGYGQQFGGYGQQYGSQYGATQFGGGYPSFVPFQQQQFAQQQQQQQQQQQGAAAQQAAY